MTISSDRCVKALVRQKVWMRASAEGKGAKQSHLHQVQTDPVVAHVHSTVIR